MRPYHRLAAASTFRIPRGHFPHLELQSAVRSQYQPLQLDCESHGPHPSKRAALVGSVRSHRTQPSSKSAIVGLGFADQRRPTLAQVGGGLLVEAMVDLAGID